MIKLQSQLRYNLARHLENQLCNDVSFYFLNRINDQLWNPLHVGLRLRLRNYIKKE